MKKPIAIFMSTCLLLTTLIGCSSSATVQTESDNTSAESFHIVTTNFALYDWTKALLGDDNAVTLTYLLDSGIDSHSYQPSADDIIEIAGCDMFIYVGGESDTWVDGVLAQSTNQDMIVLNLMDELGDSALAEEVVEGMEVSEHDHEDEEHDHEAEDHDHEDEDHTHNDEHIWLSLRNAQLLTSVIAQQLMVMHPDNADSYTSNLEDYLATLSDLDAQYTTAVDNATGNVILVADRFPLLYLVNDYDLTYYAAFNGCSAETEASFETIVFLANKVDELGLSTILTIENVQHQIAQTVSATTMTQDQTILILDSMQSTTAQDIANGATYVTIMEQNLAVLIQALS